MPVEKAPHERLLDREAGRHGNAEYLATLDEALSGLINEATWIFSRVWESNAGDLTAEIVLLILRHIMEMADAVHILLLQSATRPAQVQLRSMFEGMLYLEFILEADSDRRARAYMVGSRLHYLRFAKRLLKGSEARKQFLKEVETDPLVSDEMLATWISDSVEVEAAEAYLEGDELGDVYAAFPRKKVHWYQALEGKPSDLRALAIHLNKGAQYILIDGWSRAVHPDTIPAQIDTSDDPNSRRVRTFRDGGDMSNTATAAARILRLSVEMVLKRFRPTELEAFQRRIAEEVLPKLAELGPTETIYAKDPPE